ncbi:hypothetical protein PVAP13_6KG199400 [Panicum virgatum]|uniref:Uncharacterized protein n=1 Tax=Panicum virgatum TaxID=38727 RepID=A0A8T0RBR6_PANVG|nr:hypothetical protein PVAP13_6KG199400 [Panicum virgatum]
MCLRWPFTSLTYSHTDTSSTMHPCCIHTWGLGDRSSNGGRSRPGGWPDEN